MKFWLKSFYLFLILFLSVSCTTDMRISRLSPALNGAPLGSVALLRLSPSAFVMVQTVPAVRNKDFSSVAQQALETALTKKRKEWKIVNNANIVAMDPLFPDLMARVKDEAGKPLDSAVVKSMQLLKSQLGCRYLVLLESVSIKDASTAQTPGTLVCGCWIQLWDLEQGTMVYRARNISRPVSYVEKDFDSRLQDGLEDLFAEMVRPLPKS